MPIIKIRRNTTQGATPGVGTLTLGEIALNTEDGYLYAANNAGTVVNRLGTTVDRVVGAVPRTSATGSLQAPAGTTAQRDASPTAGSFRYNTTLTTFEGYSGAAWTTVGAAGATGAAGAAGAAGTAGVNGNINAIINGNFQINQRAVSGTVTLAAGIYGHDRWKAGASGATYTFATTNNVTVLTISAGSLIQVIEGVNLYSGTYALSFSGTAQGKIGAGSFAASGVTGTAVGGTNLNIEFNTGTVSLVQFQPGSEVSPFERRDIGRELILCQRYLPVIVSTPGSTGFAASGFAQSSSQGNILYMFKTTTRVPPTGLVAVNIGAFGFTTQVASGTGTSATFTAATINSADFYINLNSSILTAGAAGYMTTTSASGSIQFTGCEL